MPSCNDILTHALEDIGALGAGESQPSPEDSATALGHYNRLVGRWAVDGTMSPYEQNQAFTFSSSQQSYTIGPTGNFVPSGNTERPPEIIRAKLVITAASPDTERELRVINVQQYGAIDVPALSAPEPGRLYYQPTYPNGTLWPVPYPTTTSNQLRLYWWTTLGQVALGDITNNIDMPPSLEDALTLSLAERLCIPFGRKVSDELRAQAHGARQAYSQLNVQPAFIGTAIYGHDQGSWDNQDFITRGMY